MDLKLNRLALVKLKHFLSGVEDGTQLYSIIDFMGRFVGIFRDSFFAG